MSDCINLFWGS